MVTLALLGLTPLKCLSPGGLTVDNYIFIVYTYETTVEQVLARFKTIKNR